MGLVPTKVEQRLGATRLDRQGFLKQLLCGLKFVLRKKTIPFVDQGWRRGKGKGVIPRLLG
jgi:hypothetical protein